MAAPPAWLSPHVAKRPGCADRCRSGRCCLAWSARFPASQAEFFAKDEEKRPFRVGENGIAFAVDIELDRLRHSNPQAGDCVPVCAAAQCDSTKSGVTAKRSTLFVTAKRSTF